MQLETSSMEIAHNLRRLRKRAGLNQTQLSRRMKEARRVSDEFISMVEAGRRKPSVGTLEEFARVLDCTVADLVRTKRQRQKRSA